MKTLAHALSISALFGVVACGGGSPSPAGGGSQAALSSGTLVFAIAQPQSSTAARGKRPAFVSPSVSSVSIVVTGIAQAVIVSLAPGSPQCTTTGDTRTCTVALKAPLGVDTFTATLYAGPNATGSVLGIGTTVLDITSTATGFTITIPVSGEAASVRLYAAQTQFTVGVPSTTMLTVEALDSGGNVIVGPYVHPIILTDSDTTGTFTISPTTITESGTPVILRYSGGTAATSATIEANGVGISTSALSTTVVKAVPPSPAPSASPSSAPMPAGTQLFAAYPSGGVAEYNSTTGSLTQTFATALSVILVGADNAGNIYTFSSASDAAQISRFRIGAEAATATYLPTSDQQDSFSVAPTGEVVVAGTDPSKVIFDVWDPGVTGSPSRTIAYTESDGYELSYAVGPDGTLYVPYRTQTGQMYDVIPAGSLTVSRTITESLAPNRSTFTPNRMAASANGTLYVGEWSSTTNDPNAGLYVYAPSGTESLITSMDPGITGIDFDGSGNVYVASNNSVPTGSNDERSDDTAEQLSIYTAGGASLVRQIVDGVPGVGALTVGDDGTAFLVEYAGFAGNSPAGAVYRLATGASTPSDLIPSTTALDVVLYDGTEAKAVRTARTFSASLPASVSFARRLRAR